MPWSFQYAGRGVTHHEDEHYLVCTGARTLHIEPGDMLVTDAHGKVSVVGIDAFNKTYEPVQHLAMHDRQYEDFIVRAVNDKDTQWLRIIARHMADCEEAKQILRAKGYSVAGTSLRETARQVPDSDE